MKNSKNYQYLLNDISVLYRVGSKTKDLLKKKKLERCLMFCGTCHILLLTEVKKKKLKILK